MTEPREPNAPAWAHDALGNPRVGAVGGPALHPDTALLDALERVADFAKRTGGT